MKTNALPTLYKKTNTGALQQWDICVEQTPERFGVIVTRYGQVGGAIQETRDTVRKGKNIGRTNETSAYEQAVAEAKAKWKKQIERQGYVEDKERAEAGETDAEGGIAPMLAKPYEDAKHKVTYPCAMQRKFNGVRCIVMIDEGKVTLWTRKRKPIVSVPHIVKAYEEVFGKSKGHIAFDGEIYRHGWSLQKISGFVRSDKPKEGYWQLKHFVYDTPSHKGTWAERQEWLDDIEPAFHSSAGAIAHLHIVETVIVSSFEEAKSYHDKWVKEGYEGGILRILIGVYEAGKRSFFLVKVKEFKEEEFEIVDVIEGRGRYEGAAIFVCKTKEGKLFNVTSPGTLEDKADALAHKAELKGKMLTVKFFEWTDDKVPQFPVGLVVRDYE